MGFRLDMNKWLVQWIVVTLVILMAPYLIPGVKLAGPGAALAAAAVLGVLNLIVKPIVILFTLPLTIVTLGLFLVVVNALMLLMTQWFVHGFEFESFGAALWLALLISLVTTVMSRPRRPGGGWTFSFRDDARAKTRPRDGDRSGVIDLNEKDGRWQ